MEICSVEQVPFDVLKNVPWDLVITVSGYEARATFLAERLSWSAKQKIVLAYNELKKKWHRPENDRKYLDLGYDFIPVSESSVVEIEQVMQKHFMSENTPKKVLIDYSCMQKEWYAAILQFLLSYDLTRQPVEVYFSYTPSAFSKPVKRRKLSLARKRPDFYYTLNKEKPLALILGLGFEKVLIQDIYHKVKNAEIWLCYADPAWDHRFVEELEKKYASLIAETQDSHIIRYPLQHFKTTLGLLISLVLDLRIHHSVVVVPFGPKPFFLASLMVGARYPDIQVWYPDHSPDQRIYDWQPLAEPQVCRATFVHD